MASNSVKWALITGASPGGIGESEAMVLLKNGINVIATAIDAPESETLEEKSDGNLLLTLRMDVTSSESIAAVVERVQKITNGKLDYLFNNAGFGYYIPLMDVDIDHMKAQFDVNVFGLLAVTQAFFPLLRAAKGTVVNQSSVSGVQGFSLPFNGAYSSSKAAVLSLSTVLRIELSPYDIDVVTLVTGAVKTEFFKNKKGGVLPQASVYQPIRERVEAIIGSSVVGTKAYDRHRVMEESMAGILRPNPVRYLYKGYLAGIISWVFWLTPLPITDYLSIRFGALDQLKQMLSKTNSQKNK